MSVTANAYKLGNDIPELIKPQRRPKMKVATTPQNIDPEWDLKIDDYTDARKVNVKKRFIASPFLLSSFYEFLGLLPDEIRDIEVNVRLGDAKTALEEIDDLIDKCIDWRMKLSHKISIEVL